MSTSPYEYDVCLSFAGEQRQYVEEVASNLTKREIIPFYDRYEQATLWGTDLYERLDEIYQYKARYCILFISADYAHKVWTSHERKSAQARAFEQSQEYILPVRFDETKIPGIRSTVGYIDARVTNPAQLASLVSQKLTSLHGSDAVTQERYIPHGVPLTPAEQQLLIDTKPPTWEYLLFGSILNQGKDKLAPKYRDHQLRYAPMVRRIADNAAALRFIGDTMIRGGKITSNGVKLLDPATQDWAFGPHGTPGNVDNILHLGKRFIDSYEEMFDWARDIRGTAVSSDLARAFELASQLMDAPIRRVSEFIDQFTERFVGVSERVSNGEEVTLEPLTLEFATDEIAVDEYYKEMSEFERKI